jgi:hypothetical protein
VNWIRINDSLIQASGRGFTFSVRKNSVTGDYWVLKDSYTNGSDRASVKTQAEGIALAESWEASR